MTIPQLANLFTVSGFSGHGMMHAPAAGRAIAELIVRGSYETIDLTRLGYARVDLVPGANGEPLVIELELTEPSLFLGTAPGSAQRLARHLVENVEAGRAPQRC